jgi:hypothetical protein
MKALQRTLLLRRTLLAIAVVSLGVWVSAAWNRWGAKGKLPPSGGLYFPLRVEADAPSFAQSDARWGGDTLGPTDRSLAAEGCAVASAAMALGHYGIQTNPGELNRFLKETGGYTEQGWIYWEAAAELEPGKIRHAYEDLPSYRLMDWNLLRGNPVIVRIRRAGGGTHFVLVVGKVGYEYVALDPGAGGRRLFLSELRSPVEALRFYQRL